MKILHVCPINNKGEALTSWRNSQIESLADKCINYYFKSISRVNPLSLLKEGFRLRKFIKRNNIDLIHCHWGTSLSLISVLFSGKPVVVSYCGSDLLGSFKANGDKKIKGLISSYLSKFSSLLSNYNIVKSENLFNELPKKAQLKCSIIPNGVDPSFFYQIPKNESRDKLNLPKDKLIILFVNSGAWVKNPQMAYRIKNKLYDKSEIFYFLEISNIPHNKMVYYYSASDFLLITSHHEGSNNSIKESLYCNLKVISTPVGDAKEVLKGMSTCLISNCENEIVNFIETNSNSGHITPEYLKESLSIDFISEKIINIYEVLLRDRN